MRILITGGAGFIGSWLGKELGKDNDITVIDNFSAGFKENIDFKCILIKGDICNKEFLKQNLKDFDVIFHFAAETSVMGSVLNPVKTLNTNVIGTFNLLEAMRINDIKEIIFASSGGTVYGRNLFPKEETVLKPISPYGASKVFGEAYISSYSNCYDIKSLSLRYANIFGPKSRKGVIYDFVKKLKKNPKELEIFGDGKQKKSYLYITDCINASILAWKKSKKNFDVYNIGHNEWVEINEIAKEVCNELGLKKVNFVYKKNENKGDVEKIKLDITKLKSLGWKPKYSIKEGIKLYVDWLNKNLLF